MATAPVAELEAYRDEADRFIAALDEEGDPRIVELDGHPFFVATLFCFQTRSRPEQPHPLVAGFAEAAGQSSVVT